VSRRRRSARRSCPSSCQRKQRYDTRPEADRHAEALRVSVPFDFVRVYRCPVCRKWLVTCDPHRPKSKRGGR
jgi:hypothetical protein